MSPARRMSVLIVEGHDGVRTALAACLRLAPTVAVVATAATLESAVHLAEERPPDVVLYEPRTVAATGTHGVDGVTGLLVLALLGRPVVVLTTRLAAGEAAVLTQCGAVALVLKGRPLPVLLYALQTALDAHPALAERTAASTVENPRRWRAQALLDQLRAASAQAPEATEAPPMVLGSAVPVAPPITGARPPSPGGITLPGAEAADRATSPGAEMVHAAQLIVQAQQLLARSQRACVQAQDACVRALESHMHRQTRRHQADDHV